MIQSFNKQYNKNYLCLMPCNLFGPNDNYHLQDSHFLPALIKKTIDAIKYNHNYIKILGTGKAKRELIFCDDIADFLMFPWVISYILDSASSSKSITSVLSL